MALELVHSSVTLAVLKQFPRLVRRRPTSGTGGAIGVVPGLMAGSREEGEGEEAMVLAKWDEERLRAWTARMALELRMQPRRSG
ncbi:hypothetical protein AAC387_Pa03g1843 [Persea americana]